jgi:hypothetical protein
MKRLVNSVFVGFNVIDETTRINCSIQSLLSIFRIELPKDIDSYRSMMNHIGATDENLAKMIPKTRLLSWQRRLHRLVEDTFESKDYDYLEILNRIENFLKCVKPSLVSQDYAFNERLRALHPNSKGQHEPVIYSNTKTVTGRLTVVSGPNVLTLPSDFKKKLRSRFEGGKILQVDLIAAEPTVALNLAGKPPVEDPYLDVSRSIFNGEIAREVCKNTVLCSLYGQSKRNLSKKIPSNFNVDDVIERTKEHFAYESLLERIDRTTFRTDWIRNHYGRPIRMQERSEPLLVSYFLQSTAAEAALLAFSELYSRTKDHCVPVCLIHDAMLIDCKPEYHSFLLSKGILKLRANDWTFPAKVTVANE